VLLGSLLLTPTGMVCIERFFSEYIIYECNLTLFHNAGVFVRAESQSGYYMSDIV
jgi:hypothetical protein